MQVWEVVILAVVQGIAEFLPISSSGHLVIVEALLGGELENLELSVALHFGTLLSILVIYFRDLLALLWQPRLMLAIIIATLPVVCTGLLLKRQFEYAASQAIFAGCGLLVTAGLLAMVPKFDGGARGLTEIRYRDALVIGLFQAVAPLPGISRSGSTIVAALMMGVQRQAAAHFSFYIAIPALLGATILTFKDLLKEGTSGTPISTMGIGVVISFVVGVVALRGLLRVIAARRLSWFSGYCLLVGVIVIAASLSGWL